MRGRKTASCSPLGGGSGVAALRPWGPLRRCTATVAYPRGHSLSQWIHQQHAVCQRWLRWRGKGRGLAGKVAGAGHPGCVKGRIGGGLSGSAGAGRGGGRPARGSPRERPARWVRVGGKDAAVKRRHMRLGVPEQESLQSPRLSWRAGGGRGIREPTKVLSESYLLSIPDVSF